MKSWTFGCWKWNHCGGDLVAQQNIGIIMEKLPKIRDMLRTVWFRYTLFLICTFPNLHGFQSAQISICTDFDLQSRTFSSLHGFRSAQFSLCNFWICKDFALLSIRSARISICSDFDLHVFRSANQISIYGFFDLQIKF